MIGQQQNLSVANDQTLTLPALSEEVLEFTKSEDVHAYIRDRIQSANTMGFPDPMNDYPAMGFMLQPIDDRTARVILAVNDERAMMNLAKHAAAYAHWGFNLLIDEATFLCLKRIPNGPEEVPNERPVANVLVGMEVA